MRLTTLKGWLRRVLTTPAAELSHWQRAIRFALDLARHCAGELRHDKADQMAAALTYHTLFSILPIFALMLVALNAFVGPDERTEFKRSIVSWAVQTLEAQPIQTLSEESANSPGAGGRKADFDAVRASLDAQLQKVFDSLESVSFRSVGLVGALLFIYGATGLLATVERSFNAILGGDSGRPWYLRLPLYYTVLTLGPIVMLTGQWLQNRFIGALRAEAWTNWLVTPAVVATPLLTTWLVLLLVYTLLPTAPVSKRAAWIGSLVVAGLLVASRELFRLYVAGAAVTTLYGALALLPLFLLLLWWMWLIVLFGLELIYTLGAMRGQQFKRERYRGSDVLFANTSWMLPISAELAAAFARGEALPDVVLAQRLGLPITLVRPMLKSLVVAGIAHQVGATDSICYVLARPASAVTVDSLLDAASDHTPHQPADALPAWRIIEDMAVAARTPVRQLTLADLVAK